MFKDSYRVLVLGLDGATFDLMLPWIEQGLLPNLAKLVRQGAHSPLESTFPPITPCAWSSFMTGKNPGKHGLFDFVEMLPDGRGFRFTNASSRHGETLWGHLSRKGRTVGVVNVPMTYPPEPVSGYLISGLDTPHDRCRYAYPQGLKQELHKQGIDYQIDIQHLGDMRTDRLRDRRLQEMCEVETGRTRAVQYLARRYPSDFTMLVHTATDQVQHHFWHFMDPDHDKYDARGTDRYRHAIRNVYIHVDQLIGSLLEAIDSETVVIIMSDHGCGPTSDIRVRVNQALEGAGLLAFRREGRAGRGLRKMAALADRLLRSNLSDRTKRRLAGMLPGLRVWFENLDEANIDWTRTTAYANEAYRSSPAIWINRQRIASEKTTGDNDPLEKSLQAAEDAITSLKDPRTGRRVVSHVYRTRDLYHGPFAVRAPDLLLSWWEDGFLLEQSVPGGPGESTVGHSREPIQGGVEFAGSHRMNGVFVIAGGPVRQGHAFRDAKITDIAPTILYMMGIPIPREMDGRPLLEAFEPRFVADRPPSYEQDEPSDRADTPNRVDTFSKEEEDLIAQRLRSMGYIE